MTETAIRADGGPATVIDVLDVPLAATVVAVRGMAVAGSRRGLLLGLLTAALAALVLIGR